MTLTNNLMSNIMIGGTRNVTPEVGMGATVALYSDRHAYTITDVRTRNGEPYEVDIQADRAIRTDDHGMCDCQTYEYERQPDAPVRTFRKDNKGRWRPMRRNENGRLVFAGDYRNADKLIVGRRDEFYDYSF